MLWFLFCFCGSFDGFQRLRNRKYFIFRFDDHHHNKIVAISVIGSVIRMNGVPPRAASPVTLTCPPLNLLGQTQPTGISCSFSPTTVNLSKSAAATSTLTISTVAPSASPTTSYAPLDFSPPSVRPRLIWSLPVASLLA